MIIYVNNESYQGEWADGRTRGQTSGQTDAGGGTRGRTGGRTDGRADGRAEGRRFRPGFGLMFLNRAMAFYQTLIDIKSCNDMISSEGVMITT